MTTDVSTRERIPEAEALRSIVARQQQIVESLSDEDLERQTPCALWKVRDILAHQAAGATIFNEMVEALLAGREWSHTPPTSRESVAQANQQGVDRLRNDPELKQIYRSAIDRAGALVDEMIRAGRIEEPVVFPMPMPLRASLGFITVDLSVHTWDMSKAIGRPILPDPKILEHALPHTFDTMPALLIRDKARGVDAGFGFNITDIPNGEWVATVRNGAMTVERRSIAGATVATITDTATFVLVSFGRLNPFVAMLTGKLKGRGNPLLNMKFGNMLMKV